MGGFILDICVFCILQKCVFVVVLCLRTVCLCKYEIPEHTFTPILMCIGVVTYVPSYYKDWLNHSGQLDGVAHRGTLPVEAQMSLEKCALVIDWR